MRSLSDVLDTLFAPLETSRRARTGVFLFPVVPIVIFLSIKLLAPDTYPTLITEDSAVERLQALFYFAASALAFSSFATFLKNRLPLIAILYGVLAFGLLLVAVEEMSWGQRVFEIATPAYFAAHNTQNEISLHNLDFIQPILHNIYIATGAYGAFGWIVAALLSSETKKNCRHIVNYVTTDWFVSSYFFCTFLMYTLLEYIARPHPGGFLIWRDQEPAELLFALGFFLVLATKHVRLRRCLEGLAA
ncbi:MAG TPA: hypothetical protein PLG99_00175 [Kaistiaceae bacterium]|nr:hypothetical protein [Kaistiaceae bacterium]